jgi:hypothetical protein
MQRSRSVLSLVLAFASAPSLLVGCSSVSDYDLDGLIKPKKSEHLDTSKSMPSLRFGKVYAGQTVRRELVLDVSALRDGTHLTFAETGPSLKVENGCETVPSKECTIAFELTGTSLESSESERSSLFTLKDERDRSYDLWLEYSEAGSPLVVGSTAYPKIDFGTADAPDVVTRSLAVKNVSDEAVTVGFATTYRGYEDPNALQLDADLTACGQLAGGASCEVKLTWTVTKDAPIDNWGANVTSNGVIVSSVSFDGTTKSRGHLKVNETFSRLSRSFSTPPTAATTTVRVDNDGDQPLGALTFSIAGEDAALVKVTSGSCPELAAGSGCTLTVEGPATFPDNGVSAELQVRSAGALLLTQPIVGGNVMGLRVSSMRSDSTRSKAPVGRIVSTPAGIDCGKTCAVVVRSGTPISLKATANDGFAFARWSAGNDCPGAGACAVPFSAQEREVSAVFDPLKK